MLGSKELKVQHKTRTSLCWREGNKVADDNTNHREARMVFPINNSIDILEELRIDDHDTFVERFHEGVIDRR